MPRPATIKAAAFLLDTSLQCIDLLGSQYAGVDGSKDVLHLLFLHRGLIVLLLSASAGGLVIVDVLRGIFRIQYLSLVVSGLALGIDTHAHKTALEAHGHTVAVLPCGLDQIYPRQNHHLADRILTSGGALISEQPFGASLSPDSFIQRNRLISGLSGSTVFAQGLLKSGSKHAPDNMTNSK